MKLTEMLQKAKTSVLSNKIVFSLIFVVLTLIVAVICLINRNSEVKNEIKINELEKAKEVAAEDVKQWQNQINDHNNDFIESQKSLADKAQEIRNNTKPSKLPKYEKPIIHSADYNSMLDSLLVAQPD